MLTTEQQVAIQSTENKILVRAGAGTGKTEVLTRRVLHLLEQDPHLTVRNFAIITFTNKATENVKDRMKRYLFARWLEEQDATRKARFRAELESLNLAQISTIHQFCRVILNYAGPSELENGVFYAPDYSVSEHALTEASYKVVERWLRDDASPDKNALLELVPVHLIRQYLLQAYSIIRNQGLSFDIVLDQTYKTQLLVDDGNISKIKGCFIKLLKSLKQEETKLRLHSLGTDHLLEYAAKLLEKCPELIARLQEKYRHIFVDEFQDTSAFQTQILRLLCERGDHPPSLFVVGDVKQSIYKFRGADVKSYKTVEEWIRESGKILTLSTNFRSVKPIVEFVNTTFRHMQTDDDMPSFEAEDLLPDDQSNIPLQEAVRYVKLAGELPQDKVVSLIQEEVAKGASYGDFAVLFRTNNSMDMYYRALKTAGIPTQLVGAGNFYSCEEIKDMYRLLNWLVTPADPVKKEEALRTFLIRGRIEMLDALLNHISPVRDKYTVAQMIEEIMKITDARNLYRASADVQAIANLDRLKEITRSIGHNENFQLVDYVKWLSLQLATNTEEKQAEVNDQQLDAVQLITVHKAKGLEFPHVILVDLDRNLDSPGLKPVILIDPDTGLEFQIKHQREAWTVTSSGFSRAMNAFREDYLAEEARLLYVAMTRAKKKLYLLINDSVNPRRLCYQKWLMYDNES
jgi:DNA helicase-2/ATP-dependent DNA helicase PcrA